MADTPSGPGGRGRTRAALLVMLLQLGWAAVAAAQGTAPATILGQITDETGAALPGVTVSATSPSLQVAQVTVTSDSAGQYRLSPLPIGIYSVTYELSGFRAIKQEGVRLTVGFVAKLDQKLAIGSLAESITVSGISPLVDVTSTETRTELSLEAVELIPTTRDGVKAFFTQVPGVRSNLEVAASGMTEGVVYRVNGQSGGVWQTLEGVYSGPVGSFFEFNSIEGGRVQTSGSNAETPQRGMLIDLTTKSGGNDFHGNLFWGYTNQSFQSDNLNERLIALNVRNRPTLHWQNDISANLGGRIVRNKLWFFVAGRGQGTDVDALDAFYADGSPIITTTRMAYHVEKVSYQLSAKNKLIGFNHWSREQQLRDASRFVPAESRTSTNWQYTTRKLEWQMVANSSLLLSAQYGYFGYPDAIRSGITPDLPSGIDIATQFVTGNSNQDGSRTDFERHHSRGVVSWYRRNLFAGDHEIKGGVDHYYTRNDTRSVTRPAGEYQLRFNNTAPFQINIRNTPTTSRNRESYLGLYAQDNWHLGQRLTLSYGLRFDHTNGFVPAQCREAAPFAEAGCFPEVSLTPWNAIGPRVHVSYDVFGNGKMAIKGGYGRFNQLREGTEVSSLNPNRVETATYRWQDLNGNRNYDAGEVDLSRNGPDFVSIAAGTARVPNPDEKQPRMDEFSLALERELIANWSVKVGGNYSRRFNTQRLVTPLRPYDAYNIPIVRPDPGADNLLNTADDPGTSITLYEYPVAFRGAQFDTTMSINDPRADQNFKTIELSTGRRFVNGWQITTSYSATKKHIPFSSTAFNPNAEVFAEDNTWEWSAKASGAYSFPYGLMASANYEHRSGDVGARQVLFTGGVTIPTIVLNVEPIGSQRTPNTNMLDLGVTKRLRIANRDLSLRIDMFNALNISSIRTWNLRAGADFLAPVSQGGNNSTAIVPPRIIQFATTFAF